jgi:hypothetical protein
MKIQRFSPLVAPTSILGTVRLLLLLAVAAMLVSQSTVAQQPVVPKLTLTQIEGLVTNHVPDSTLQTQIQRRGLAFAPTPAIVESLRAKGAGPLTLSAIETSSSPPPNVSPRINKEPLAINATAQPGSVTQGQSAVLSWEAVSAARITLDGNTVQAQGTITESPAQTMEYLFKATDSAGKAVTKSVTVTVLPPVPPTISLQVTPGSIQRGQTTTLNWQSNNASNVTINGTPVEPNGAKTLSPVESTTYQAVAKGQGGQTASSVALVVVTPPPPRPYTVPQRTNISVFMIDSLDSGKSSIEQRFHASLDQDLIVDGKVVVPKGADVYGRVVDVKKGRLGSEAELKLELTELDINKQPQTITTLPKDLTSNGRSAGTGGTNGNLGTTVNGVISDFKSNKVTISPGSVLEFTLLQPFTITLNP